MPKPSYSTTIALAISVLFSPSSKAAETQTCVPVELTFVAAREYEDSFNDVTVDLEVRRPSGKRVRVPMFWAGNRVWKARYASAEEGTHQYQTVCSETSDKGLHRVTGKIEIAPYRGSNPLLRHGQLRIAANRRHFEYDDGTPLLWIGDTCWMGLSNRLHWPDEFQEYVADRKQKGFNVIQIVAGLYPDMPAFDPRGANEAGFPWTEEYTQIRPEYFDAADRRINYLVENGVTPCIVGAWGFHMPWMGIERLQQHWRYLIARYGAYPVVWCVAGEANLPYYLTPGFPFDDRKQVADWTVVARYVRQTDAFQRLVSIHPTGLGRLSARGCIDDAELLDFDMLQTGHGDLGSLGPTIETARWTYAAKPTMPFLNSEVCYEGILGTCDDSIQRLMVWSSLLSGAAGHTYGANGIWQVNRRDQPYGKSPHGGDYGSVPWDKAMHLPGSTHVGLAGQILSRFPWTSFEPHTEWATFVQTDRPISWGRWIWSSESDSTQDAAVEGRYFRRSFDIPLDSSIEQAVLYLGADDAAEAWLNGQPVAKARGWNPANRSTGLAQLLAPGRNVLAVHARNMPAPVKRNPAGLIASLQITLKEQPTIHLVTDKQWSVSQEEFPRWQLVEFDDAPWGRAREMASYGEGPWGSITTVSHPWLIPYSTGTSDGHTRLIYLPIVEPLIVHSLEIDGVYKADWIDPLTGRSYQLGRVTPDDSGNWRTSPPPNLRQDWLLAIVRQHEPN
jgi:hypothetical protein